MARMEVPAFSQVSEYDEILIHAVPIEHRADQGDRRRREYQLRLYTRLELRAPRGPAAAVAGPPVDAPPAELAGLPLAGQELLTVRWQSYAAYLAAFPQREEPLRALAQRSRTSGLDELLRARAEEDRPLRLWWMSDAPELEDVPWEHLTLDEPRSPRLSLARGRPPGSRPPLPLPPERPLTIAVFDPEELAPAPLRAALAELHRDGPVRVVPLPGRDPREALREAARAGVEIVHLVADASVALGVEGLLDLPGQATLAPPEIAALLRGSRAAVLSLSAPAEPSTGGGGAPTVFHGFARFGRAAPDGPSVVAPVGPIEPAELGRFWRAFYTALHTSLDVEEALGAAAPSPLRVPIVLFLRQRFGRQFTRREDGAEDVVFDTGGEAGQESPAELCERLAVTATLLDRAQDLERRYAASGLPFPAADLIQDQQARQRALASRLDLTLARGRER